MAEKRLPYPIRIYYYTMVIMLLAIGNFTGQNQVKNFVFFNIERHRIQEKSFLESDIFQGAQLKYTWLELEPEKDKYNFDLIQKDLDFLKSNGKELFVQIQDVSFDKTLVNLPR